MLRRSSVAEVLRNLDLNSTSKSALSPLVTQVWLNRIPDNYLRVARNVTRKLFFIMLSHELIPKKICEREKNNLCIKQKAVLA